MPTEFEARVGPSLWLQTKCNGCDCPPSRVTWVAPRCAGTIAGTVADGRTGEPLGNIALWVQSAETGSYGEAVTDELGHYRIGRLRAGEGYVLTASGPGYSYRLLEDVVLPEEGLVQHVALVRTGAIRGTIRDGNDMPIEGVTVYFAQQDARSHGAGKTQTNEYGEFCYCDLDASNLENLNTPTYSILAVHPDYSFIQTTRSVTPHYIAGDEIKLEGAMPERAVVQGTVSVGGLPVPDASVYVLSDLEGMLLDEEIATTDANGFFSLRVHAPASYELVVAPNEAPGMVIPIEVVPGEVFLMESLDFPAPGSISGTVTDLSGNPVEGAEVEALFLGDDSPLQSVLTSEGGHYELVGLPPADDYVVRVSVPTAEETTGVPFRSGIAVFSNQTTIVDLQGDVVSPTCAVTSPASNSIVSGTVLVSLTAADNQSVGTVILRVGETIVSSATISQSEDNLVSQTTLSLEWNSTLTPNGQYFLTVDVFDIAGNRGTDSVAVVVQN